MKRTITASAILVLTCSPPAERAEHSSALDRRPPIAAKQATAATNLSGPSRKEAAEAIERSELFHQRRELGGFPVGPFRLSATRELRVEEHFVSRGWITLNGDVVAPSRKALASRNWRPRTDPGCFDVLLDDRQVIEATGIVETGHNAYTVEFTWRWVPNEVGEGLTGPAWTDHFGSVLRGTAVVRRYDDGWRATKTSELEGLLSERVSR